MRVNILASVLLALLPFAATTSVEESDLGVGAENDFVDTISSSLALSGGNMISARWGRVLLQRELLQERVPTTASRSQPSSEAAAAAMARPAAFDEPSKSIDTPGEA
ncbi:unnamed protein product [Rhizoctonia solani]|uniref:Uncharacterized protein n=1 Tax=Rhizoctonia solani TaxID=456999 RepID=A0A8H3B3E8_9AGAM|nr:unnamed protein product [Rhizoctonia solani]